MNVRQLAARVEGAQPQKPAERRFKVPNRGHGTPFETHLKFVRRAAGPTGIVASGMSQFMIGFR